jgi:hypothetical protein
MRRRLLVALITLSFVAGCGGVGDYSAAETRSCLEDEGLRVGPPGGNDFVARTGTAGAFRARVDGNRVTLVFGDSEEEAGRTAQAYRRFSAANVGLDGLLFQERNVVQLWVDVPDETQRDRIKSCLKSA